MNKIVIASSLYLPPIAYYAYCYKYKTSFFEDIFEYYQKQSYRNRCVIATSQGTQSLTIPIERDGKKTPMNEVRLSMHNNWQQIHWQALKTAYCNSPFFEYYEDELYDVYLQDFTLLLDFNRALQQKIEEWINFDFCVQSTQSYVSAETESYIDIREKIHPKKECSIVFPPYYQVFQQQVGFLPNLSIVDLLFNLGPESLLYIDKMASLIE